MAAYNGSGPLKSNLATKGTKAHKLKGGLG
jgi:hypothetical protein